MNTRKFNCTQHELSAVCLLGWESCIQHIEKFNNFKTKYNVAFVEKRKKEIEDMMLMPDFNRRTSNKQLLMLELKEMTHEIDSSWQQLKRHIIEAWDEPEQKLMLKAAGLLDFKKALKNRWESYLAVLISGNSFIEEKKGLLLANENMPEKFVTHFSGLLERYRELYARHLDSNRSSKMETSAFRDIQNKVYMDLMSMCKDAQVIFKDYPSIKEGFYFENMIGHVTGTSWAGIRGLISNGHLIHEGIPGIVIKLRENGEEAIVEDNGNFHFDQLAAGFYTLEVNAPGYLPKRIERIEVKTGSYIQLEVDLEKINEGGFGGSPKLV